MASQRRQPRRRRGGPPYRRPSGRWAGKVNWKGSQYWVGTFDTPEEWKIAAGEILSKLARGDNPRTAGMTIGQFIDDGWPDSHRAGKNKEASLKTLRYTIRRLRESFGDRQLDGGISRREARIWSDEVPLAALKAALALYKDAIFDDLATDSPFRGLAKRVSPGRKEIKVISNEEFQTLADLPFAIWDQDFAMIMSAFIRWQGETGMRPGETSSLCWEHISFKRGTIDVRTCRTKTKHSTTPTHDATLIALPEGAARAVRRMPRLDPKFVFPSITGRQLNKRSVYNNWSTVRTVFIGTLPADHWLRRRVAVKDHFALYELRHRAATWMLEPPPHGLGLSPADVAQQLGHSDGGVRVMQLYGHPDKIRSRERTRRAAEEATKRALGRRHRPPWLKEVEGSDQADTA